MEKMLANEDVLSAHRKIKKGENRKVGKVKNTGEIDEYFKKKKVFETFFK
ncbi:MAG: hypothetical protein BAJALOKI3v1_100076 [Promethearchaeota archaeon]|jgi:hypothetical protein|nr:MAG: hypothetical protein BAJALOKI3v1_100076 [Candidatus Lokiarchaeota archaeon]